MKRASWMMVVVVLCAATVRAYGTDEEEKRWADYFDKLVDRDPDFALDYFAETASILSEYGSGIVLSADGQPIELRWEWSAATFVVTTPEGDFPADDLPDPYGRHVFSTEILSGWVDVWNNHVLASIRYDGKESGWSGELPPPEVVLAVMAQLECVCKGSNELCEGGNQDCQNNQPCTHSGNVQSHCIMTHRAQPPREDCMPQGVTAVLLPMAVISFCSLYRRRRWPGGRRQRT